MASSRVRIDKALAEAGLVQSRSRARDLILNGKVSVDGQAVVKADFKIHLDQLNAVEIDDHGWVSRAALKLVHALDYFAIDPTGKNCMDLGASTGGFVEVLLSRDAKSVTAIDVGQYQLAEKVKQDPRVSNYENLNVKDLQGSDVRGPFDIITSDLSFISLKKALPAALTFAGKDTLFIGLIKPQFEVGKGRLAKGGLVLDEELHQEVCLDLQQWLEAQTGWSVVGLTDSPIKGGDGNKEFLIVGKYAA